MKKIELNAALKFVLIILSWLLTITVVNIPGASLNNGGVGLIGTLLIYVGLLYLAFGYFKDEDLQRHVKLSLIVLVIIVVTSLVINCYGYIVEGFELTDSTTIKISKYINSIFSVTKNITIAAFLIYSLVISLTKKEEDKTE